MDYSIYDAYQAGIRKVVIIIREELTDLMQAHFQNLPTDLELQFVYQDVKMIPAGFSFPERTKPWGTGHAILCCKDVVKEPFIVVNADDYYGSEIFSKINSFTQQGHKDYCMAGFFLKNTLSENGGVNRGICQVDSNMHLLEIKETFQIERKDDQAVGTLLNGEILHLDLDAYCSLNLWGFMPTIFEELELQFGNFLQNLKEIEKEEFLLPDIVESMIKENKINVKVLPTHDEWFGMTYQEDRAFVETKLATYCKDLKYPVPLWKGNI